jgi:hypothetical protein
MILVKELERELVGDVTPLHIEGGSYATDKY